MTDSTRNEHSASPTIAVVHEPTEPRPGLGSRAAALTALVGVGGSLGWLALSLVRLFSDSWVAPISLSPDSDQILQLDLQLTRERAEMDRVSAELARIEAEIGAIDGGLARLETLRHRAPELFEFGAERSSQEAAALGRGLASLRDERAILERLVTRQESELALAREHLAAGMIQRRDLERQEQSLDTLRLQLVGNARAADELRARQRSASSSATEYRSSVHGESGRPHLPDIAARQESEVRLELEIMRLEAERRGLVALREAGRRNLAELEEVMHQIEERPLYRATQRQMDVAFVPYEQLEGVRQGAPVVQCEAGIFFCHDVGTVSEVIPGEVVTQDPWGELARGRYAVLELREREAVEERILRVRGS